MDKRNKRNFAILMDIHYIHYDNIFCRIIQVYNTNFDRDKKSACSDLQRLQ